MLFKEQKDLNTFAVLPIFMQKKIILIYNLKGNDSERIKFNRQLFKYNIQSHKGKYKTTSKGILKKYEKPVRSVVIFDKRNIIKVKKIISKFNVDYRLYEIYKEIK